MDIMKDIIYRKFNLEKYEPRLYCLYNRPHDKKRYITNINDHYSELIKIYRVNWIRLSFKNYKAHEIFVLF